MKSPILILLSALLVPAAPPAAVPSTGGVDAERLARVRPSMDALVRKGEIPGAVMLLARHGKIVLHEAVGYRDLENKRPMQKDSIFQIMSMTKPFTGVAIMMLMEEGKLSINDPVEKDLPAFKGQQVGERPAGGGARVLRKPVRPITIRDLMSHISGMSGPHGAWADFYQRLDHGLAEAVDAYAKEPLEFEPGSKWQYSNTGIATLGRIIEVVSDQPYEAFIEARLLKPLGMKDTFFFAPPARTERIAFVYSVQNGKLVLAGPKTLGGDSTKYRAGSKYAAPEFGLYSTAADLFRFYQMMLNNGTLDGKRYLSKAAVDVMTMPHTGDLKAGHMPGTAFGLTWEVVRDPIGLTTLLSPGTFGHGGAFGTHGWIDRQKDVVGVYMVQRANDSAKNAFFQLAGSSVVD